MTQVKMKIYHLIALSMLAFECQISLADEAKGYVTTGVGSLQKCKKFGIQLCDSEKVSIPKSIDPSAPSWIGVYHNTRKDGTSMCWIKLKNGPFSVETLSFDCYPIN
jgi:hypothetical protein